MSDDFGIDLDEVRRVIENSEVLIIRLETVGSRVLVDFRSTSADPPHISRVPRVNSVEERVRAVKELRPAFPYPEKLMSFAWPRRVSIIAESGAEFARVRIGIGRPLDGDEPTRDPDLVANYVLADPVGAERTTLEETTRYAADAVEAIVAEGVERASSRFNRRGAGDGPDA